MNFVEASRKFIELDTTAEHSNQEALEWLKSLCEGFGFEVELQNETLAGLNQANIIIRPKVSAHQELMLQTHTDTNNGGHFSMWSETTQNPFNATIRDGHIYGLGAANSKLDLLCKIWAGREFINETHKTCSFVIVGTFGELKGMSGAIKLMRKKRVRAKYALVGQPTDLKLCHAGLGAVEVEISIPFTTEERDYHLKHDLMESSSSQSKLFSSQLNGDDAALCISDNAIGRLLLSLDSLPNDIVIMDVDGGSSPSSLPPSAMLEVDMVAGLKSSMVQKLRAIARSLQNLEERFKEYEDPEFKPKHAVLNIGMVRTHKELVRLVGTCRVPPAVPEDTYMAWLEQLRLACEQEDAKFRVVDYKQPFRLDCESDFTKKCVEALGESASSLGTIAYSTEASVFSRLGVNCLVFGPGSPTAKTQVENEYVTLEALERAQQFYKDVIARVCQ